MVFRERKPCKTVSMPKPIQINIILLLNVHFVMKMRTPDG